MIREGAAGEAPIIARLLERMVREMASMGGHPASDDREVWAGIEERILSEVGTRDHLFLLAEVSGPGREPVGCAKASIVSLAPVFRPKRLLHIHGLYVIEAHRRRGIARALLEALLDWGKRAGCDAAELGVLAGNPARSLYEELGFTVFNLEMTRDL